MSKLEFRTDFDPHHGEAVELVAGVQRITAPNSGPFTQHGTNTTLSARKKSRSSIRDQRTDHLTTTQSCAPSRAEPSPTSW